jgi:hypothetical protein
MATAQKPFDPEYYGLDWLTGDWALNYLPWIRIAVVMNERNSADFEHLIEEGLAPEFVEGVTMARDHLQKLVGIMNVVLARMSNRH